MFFRWVLTVLSANENWAAISRLDNPALTNCSTCCSRVVMDAAVDSAANSALGRGFDGPSPSPDARRICFTKGWVSKKYMRDAKLHQIYEGTNQIQRLVIANELLR